MRTLILAWAFGLLASGTLLAADDSPASRPSSRPWIGVHVQLNSHEDADAVQKSIPALAKMGVNVLVMHINYVFEFDSDKEMRDGNDLVTKAQAKTIGDLCRKNGIRPIPGIDCLGHQSWEKHTAPLLAKHPEFDETPGKYKDNVGIYCRSWCPSNPDVYKKVFPMIDEMIDAFGADAFHVGMDEVLIIGDDDCPLCRGKSPADFFAKAVNDLHDHLVGQKKVEMLMWGDRLLDAKTLGYSKWEASENGTFPAVDMIPKDIIICDWHYEKQAEYKSVPFLLGKGFRVWPSGWKDVTAAGNLMDYALAQHDPRMLGYLSTTWGSFDLQRLDKFPPTQLAVQKLNSTKPR